MPSLAGALGPALAVVALALAAVAAPATAGERSDTVTIDPGSHAPIEFQYQEDPAFNVEYDVGVRDGPNIDVLVMDNANYQSYSDGDSFSYVGSWSSLDTGAAQQSFTVEQKGTYYIVLDHTSEPDNGASPATVNPQSVTAEWTVITKLAVQDSVERGLPAAGAGLASMGLAAAALVAARRR
jgi:hypothetical protein